MEGAEKEKHLIPPETHKGVVLTMGKDDSEVWLVSPEGKTYQRNLRTSFLTAIGIKDGDKIQLESEERAEPGVGTLTTKVTGLGPANPEIVGRVRLAKFMGNVRQTFGPLIYDSRNQD